MSHPPNQGQPPHTYQGQPYQAQPYRGGPARPVPPAQPQPTYQPQPPPAKRRGSALPALIAGVAAGLVGLVVGVAIGGSTATTTTAGPEPTRTITMRPTATVTVTEQAPTEEPSTTDPSTFKPKRSDFSITVKILKKTCFGSAGCNITFRIKPTYLGVQDLPDTGVVEVTYRVLGGESGPQDNTFTISGGEASYDKEESIGTTSSGTKLSVKIVDVNYDENG